MDDVIRDLAKAQGRDNLSDTDVKELRGQLSLGYIDDVLDGRFEPPSQPAPKQEGKANAI